MLQQARQAKGEREEQKKVRGEKEEEGNSIRIIFILLLGPGLKSHHHSNNFCSLCNLFFIFYINIFLPLSFRSLLRPAHRFFLFLRAAHPYTQNVEELILTKFKRDFFHTFLFWSNTNKKTDQKQKENLECAYIQPDQNQ